MINFIPNSIKPKLIKKTASKTDEIYMILHLVTQPKIIMCDCSVNNYLVDDNECNLKLTDRGKQKRVDNQHLEI